MLIDREVAPARIAAAVRAGVDIVQVRDAGLEAGPLLRLTRAAMAAAAGTAARVVVNDRLDVALAAGAAGVHLRGSGFGAVEVRRIAPAGFLVGRSVHAEEEALRLDAEGACDYLLFGTVFRSASKPAGHPVAGVEALRRICGGVRTPVLAIGGVTIANAPAVRAAGAGGAAAIGLFRHGDIAETATALRIALGGGAPHSRND